MTSSTTSPATSTAHTSLLALTTPFVPPTPSCANIFTTTSTVTSYYWNNFTATTLKVVYSDPSNARFTQCQPRGWDEVVQESRFHFSPAVCPDQWTAYALKDVYVNIETPSLSGRATTAYCCASGHTLNGPAVSLQSLDTLACISVIGVEATATSSTVSASQAPAFPNGIQIHNAYQISWDETDKATLSPTPPDFSFGCGATLSMWIPGESVGPLPCNNGPGDGGGSKKGVAMGFVMVGIPIIVVALIATCCGVHFRNARRRRRAIDQVVQDGSEREPVANPGVQLENVKT